jgi:hypothetical protein
MRIQKGKSCDGIKKKKKNQQQHNASTTYFLHFGWALHTPCGFSAQTHHLIRFQKAAIPFPPSETLIGVSLLFPLAGFISQTGNIQSYKQL